MKLIKILVLLLCFLLSGCFGRYSLSNIDKPAPKPYEEWEKPGATTLDIKKAILECGAPHYAMTGFIYEHLGMHILDEQLRYGFIISGCMEQAGFKSRWASLARACKWQKEYETYPACQPNAVFPTPSREIRMNSWFCKIKTDRDYCRKFSLTPEACDEPGRDFSNPPPECK